MDPSPVPPLAPTPIELLLLKMRNESRPRTWIPCSPPFHDRPANWLLAPLFKTHTVLPARVTFVTVEWSRSENTRVSSIGEYWMLLVWQALVVFCAVPALTMALIVPSGARSLMSSQLPE